MDPESGRLDAEQSKALGCEDWSGLNSCLGRGDILDGKTGQAIDPLSGEVVEDGSYIDDGTGRTVPLRWWQSVVPAGGFQTDFATEHKFTSETCEIINYY